MNINKVEITLSDGCVIITQGPDGIAAAVAFGHPRIDATCANLIANVLMTMNQPRPFDPMQMLQSVKDIVRPQEPRQDDDTGR